MLLSVPQTKKLSVVNHQPSPRLQSPVYGLLLLQNELVDLAEPLMDDFRHE
jgi:hypothetical protein